MVSRLESPVGRLGFCERCNEKHEISAKLTTVDGSSSLPRSRFFGCHATLRDIQKTAATETMDQEDCNKKTKQNKTKQTKKPYPLKILALILRGADVENNLAFFFLLSVFH